MLVFVHSFLEQFPLLSAFWYSIIYYNIQPDYWGGVCVCVCVCVCECECEYQSTWVKACVWRQCHVCGYWVHKQHRWPTIVSPSLTTGMPQMNAFPKQEMREEESGSKGGEEVGTGEERGRRGGSINTVLWRWWKPYHFSSMVQADLLSSPQQPQWADHAPCVGGGETEREGDKTEQRTSFKLGCNII